MSLRLRRRWSFGVAVLAASIAHAALLRLPLYEPRPAPMLGEAHPVLWLASSTPPAISSPAPALDSQANTGISVSSANSPHSELSDPTATVQPAEAVRESPARIARDDMPPDQATLSAQELARYHPASELGVRAVVMSPLDLDMQASPDDVRGGRARFTLLISADGSVDRVAVDSSTLSVNFLGVALSKFYGAHFRPAQIDGVPVPARAIIEVSDLQD